MIKKLIRELDTAFENGTLSSIIERVSFNTEVLKELGYSGKGQYLTIVRNYLIDKNLTLRKVVTKINKICPVCSKEFEDSVITTKPKTTCSVGCSNSHFRTGINNGNFKNGKSTYRDIALRYYPCKCNRCGYDENSAAIVVHHIDHNRENNSIDNLEVLCANCHAIHHWADNSTEKSISGSSRC